MNCPECQDTGSVPIGADGPHSGWEPCSWCAQHEHRHGQRWAHAPLVRGGQGRTVREVEQSATAIAYLTVVAFVLVCALAVAVAIGGAA